MKNFIKMSNTRKTPVRIIDTDSNQVKVKFPFLNIPVMVSKNYYKHMLQHDGYEVVE